MSATIEIRVRVPGCRIDINIDRPTLPEALTDASRLLTASTQGVPDAATAPATQDGAQPHGACEHNVPWKDMPNEHYAIWHKEDHP